ncbi:sugar ABC transporter substrate-binding protein [Butyrivibrio sp. X503]|uniref:multiple monosaccharide ABC transporter substrate-binding protein n=1 Tax=Butyrivibrio sp. X503 TaxID=2364878 RepID=UPI000EA9FBC1|nr:multiple monosaccharide ABC transporter substrate-binding protein [Butyrivibrio sp. X503]RKM55466.1 sugar ABC transporter substrate-binding protein [Butyrivibrio sp. X503]
MKKKIIGALLSVAMVTSALVGCGSAAAPAAEAPAAEAPAETAEEAPAAEAEAPAEAPAAGGKVGVSMPTKDLQRWNQDGANMEAQLKEAGYEVDLQYASNDVPTQVSQIENMISSGAKVLVIAPIEGDSLGTVLQQAKEAGVAVIAYDRLIMNSDAVTYYATFDNKLVGTKQGQYIEEKLDLKNQAGPFNLEIFTGDPGDNNANFFYSGAMEVLQPYIDEGKLVVKSGQVEFDKVATPGWATEAAQSRMDGIISANYADGTKLDAVLCSNDFTALGAINSLKANYTGEWPIVTGQDCDKPNVKLMIEGKQSMSIFKDTRDLAAQTVKMVDSIMKGGEAPVNDTESYDNGVITVPSYLCEPVFADKDSYKKLLIDSGYYTEDDLK